MLNRRLTLLAAAGAITMPGLPRPRPALAQAAAPAAPPGFHRFRVGGWTVTTVHDGFFARPVEGFVRNASLEEVRAVLAESFLPGDLLAIPFTITFIQRGDTLAVFDAGNGVTPAAASNGKMIANMAAAGIDPARVTHVIQSHFHGDHINGLLGADNGRAFPNAEVLVPAPEWAWWTDETNSTRSPEGQRGNFANTARRFAPYRDRVKPFQPGAEVIPGVSSIAAHGHTPGHTIFRIADGDAQFMFLADVTNRPELMAPRPDWQIVFDFDGAMAAATRRRVLDMVATDRIRVTGYHYPFPANGFIARQGNGFRFVPADWNS